MPANLYDYPRYYDLVFGSDWKAEFDFLRQAFDKFVEPKVRQIVEPKVRQIAGKKVRSVFEPACGTGRLLFRLALAGYDVSGLDLNPRAVDYCNKRLARRDKKPSVFVGDMADFELPRPVDAAFNMINSFRHLLSEKQARGHLQCIARALKPGGIYCLGLHLTPTEGTAITEERWSARRGHLGINTHLATHDLDLKSRTEHCTMTMDVYTPKRMFQITDELTFRTYTWPQMQQLLATARELELAATFDFRYQIEAPIEVQPDTQDVVLILRRKA